MPKPRLARHFFVTYAVALVTVLAGCYWLTTVRMASVTEEAEFERMTAAAVGLADVLEDVADFSGQEPYEQLSYNNLISKEQKFEIIDFQGSRIDTKFFGKPEQNDTVDSLPDLSQLLSETQSGRIAKTSRFNVDSNSRLFVVAVPFSPGDIPSGALCLSVETKETDRILSDSLKQLFLGYVLFGLCALIIGWFIALWVAKPVHDLARAVQRVASGDGTERILKPEVAELAAIAEATSRLKEKLVERGLTLGRRDTEQEAVLDSMMEGVLAVDVRQRIVGLNQAAARLLNIDIEVALRQPLQSVVRNPAIRHFVLRAIDCREPIEDDFDLPGPPKRTMRAHGTALRDPSGEGGAVIVLNDVTELERLEIVRQDFVANVSHELKTPIATIKGFVETLLDGAMNEPDDNTRFLSIVAKQADRLESIIEDLLALSRIEQSEDSGSLPLESTRIADLLATACSDCMPRAAEQGIEMNIECDTNLIADVNAPLMEQAVVNLIENAVKYSGTHQPILICARLKRIPSENIEELTISVADHGCGIHPEHLPRLFERFYRVDKGRSRQAGGTGLGLSIVKHIVQAHGGTISVDSQLDEGSLFCLRIPCG